MGAVRGQRVNSSFVGHIENKKNTVYNYLMNCKKFTLGSMMFVSPMTARTVNNMLFVSHFMVRKS